MGLVLLLIVAVLFVPPFYQKKYFAEYNTITKGKAFESIVISRRNFK